MFSSSRFVNQSVEFVFSIVGNLSRILSLGKKSDHTFDLELLVVDKPQSGSDCSYEINKKNATSPFLSITKAFGSLWFTQKKFERQIKSILEPNEVDDIQKETIELKVKKSTRHLSTYDEKWIKKVDKILRNEVNNSQFNNKWLADRLFLSERQLQRKIKEITGFTPNLYFRELKLQTAYRLATSGNYATVSQIAFKVGFECPRYFAKIFKRKYSLNVADLIKKPYH